MNQKRPSLVCKQKHVLKSGAPPHKFGDLHCLFTINSISFTTESISMGYHHLVHGIM